MRPVWESLYDRVKDRRYGALFLFASGALVGFGLALILCRQWLSQDSEHEWLIGGLCGILVVLLVAAAVRGWMDFQARRRPGGGDDYSRLSSDELSKARSKLLKNQSRRNL